MRASRAPRRNSWPQARPECSQGEQAAEAEPEPGRHDRHGRDHRKKPEHGGDRPRDRGAGRHSSRQPACSDEQEPGQAQRERHADAVGEHQQEREPRASQRESGEQDDDCRRRGDEPAGQAESVDLVLLHAKIGQQALELDFLNSALTKAGLLSAKS